MAKQVIAALMRSQSEPVIVKFLEGVFQDIDAAVAASRPAMDPEEEESSVTIEEIEVLKTKKGRPVPAAGQAGPSPLRRPHASREPRGQGAARAQ